MARRVKLPEKQQRFADEYLVDLNATQAYQRAGYRVSEAVAAVNALRLLQKPAVRTYVEARQEALRKATEITQERVLREYARLAFFDVRLLFSADGTPLPVTELDANTAACVAGLEVLEQFEGAGESREFVGYLKKYKLADKKGALDSLARHLGMFKEQVEHSGSVEVRKSELGEILAQMRGSGSG